MAEPKPQPQQHQRAGQAAQPQLPAIVVQGCRASAATPNSTPLKPHCNGQPS